MKVGDLIKWTHYGIGEHTIHYGLFLRKVTQRDILFHKDWGDVWVWTTMERSGGYRGNAR